VRHNLLEHSENDPNFMNSIIMGDETWVLQYNPEMKAQSSQWKNQYSSSPKET
jgi:hypothetical protein